MQVLAGDGLAFPTGLAVAAILARTIGVDGYGIFALALSISTGIEWLMTSLLSRASIKLVSEEPDWKPVAASLLRIHTGIGLAVGATLLVLAWPIGYLLDQPSVGICLAILAPGVTLFTSAMACRNILVGRGRFRARALMGAARWITRLVAIAAFALTGFAVAGAVLGHVLGALAALIVSRVAVGRLGLVARADIWGPFRDLAMPAFALAITLRILDKTGLVALRAFGGSLDDLGLYAAAQNFGAAPALAVVSFTPLLLASTTQALGAGDERTARAMGRDAFRLMTLSWPFAAITVGSALEIVRLVYGPAFDQAASLAAPFIVSAFGFAIVSVVSALLTAVGQAHVASRSAWPMLPLALVGYIAVVPRFGAAGAAWTTALTSIAGAALSWRALHACWKLEWPMATAARSIAVSIVVGVLASVWPTPGLWWLGKAAVLSVAACMAFVALGEVGESERAFARTWLRARRGPEPSEYWDGIAHDWNEGRDGLWRQHSDIVNLALCQRWLPSGMPRLLKTDAFDEATSDGLYAGLRGLADGVYAIDVSPAVATRARHRHPALPALAADVRTLPFADASFDAVVSLSTLDHFGEAGSIDQALRELHRVLKPAGRLVLTLDNPANPLIAMRNALPFAWLNRAGLVPYFVGATLSPAALRQAVIASGFDVSEMTATLHCPRVIAVAASRSFAHAGASTRTRFLAALRRADALERWPTRFLTGHFVAVLATKRT